jgi:hypothetical protein
MGLDSQAGEGQTKGADMTDHTPLGPLPEYALEFRPRWPGDEGGFTGAQMRVYARQERAAERERCAAIVQANADACLTDLLRDVLASNAAAIRAQDQG